MQVIPFIPESAPFNPEQRLWLNGYVAGLMAGRGFVPGVSDVEPARATVPLLVVFGSQTGTAERLARQIAKDAKPRGVNAGVMDAADHAKIEWAKETNLLIVTSTYGDGDMPDNAQGFWDWLQTDAAKELGHVRYSVLALGDTNYEHFCAAGKKIDARLEQLGAQRVHPLAECYVDYEAKAKEWMGGAIAAFMPPNGGPASATDPAAEAATANGWSKTNPFPARLIANRCLNLEGSEKETRHFEISLEDSGLSYEAGDALGVWPVNCPELVMDTLEALGCKGDELVATARGEMPLGKALGSVFDINKPGPELLKYFAERNPAMAALLAPERKDEFKKWLWGRGVIDLLLENSSSRPLLTEFAALLKPIAPRLYSISSSPKAHAGQVHLTVNVVRYEAHGRARKGLASTFLADRSAAETGVPIFFQSAPGFRLPLNGGTPVIMVGPGTGVAPFRAFLHERRATGAKGRNWLFFGEQRAATDFYYRDEIQQMQRDGHLTQLCTAFSRDQAEKVYVQHRMLENAAQLWAWLEDGAHFYVCGDASRMARDVEDALHKVIETAAGQGADVAKAYVARMKSDKRYQRDVY